MPCSPVWSCWGLVPCSEKAHLPLACGPVLLTLVFEVLQDGDNGLQGDVMGQKELPGTVLLKGFPV